MSEKFNTVECARCKVEFGLLPSTEATLRQSSAGFNCPFGHELVFNKLPSGADKLRLERDRLKQQLAQRDDEIARQRDLRQMAERQTAAARGQVTRLKNRAAAGVCPCCNRSFENLRRHMTAKHKGFVAEEIEA